jgi:hypothetical protein
MIATVETGAGRLYAQTDDGAQLIGMSLVLAAGTAYQTMAQNGLAALSAETILRTPIRGSSA